MPSRLKQLWSTLRRDFEANDGELRPRTFVSALLVPNRYGAITWLRLYQLFEDRRVPSAVAYRVLLHLHGLEMDRNVEIGPGLFLPHPRGLLFASGTRIGTDCAVYGMVRFLRNDRGPPRIEDGALLGDGARILGPVTVGPGARVGAGSVVTRDVPPEDTVAGSPARPVRGGANGSSRPRHDHDVEGDGGGGRDSTAAAHPVRTRGPAPEARPSRG